MKNNKTSIIHAVIGTAIALTLGVLAFVLLNYLFVPRIGWSGGLLITIALSAGVAWATGTMYSYIFSSGDNTDFSITRASMLHIVIGLCVVSVVITWIVGWRCFHIDEVKGRLEMTTVSQKEFEAMMPDIDADGAYSWIDSDTARQLASRKMGELTDLVSLFTTSNTVHTTVSNGKIVKYVPLEYGGFFKSTKVDTIPGYMVVDPVSQKAEYVKCEFSYSPSAYFSKDLMRHLRNNFPSEYFGNYTFQVSPEGVPHWVIEAKETCGSWTVTEVYGVVVVNAQTGKCDKYSLEDAPAWVVSIHGDTAMQYYNVASRFVNGWLNLSKKGQTSTTDDFGYVTIGGDLYYYTGITSVVTNGGDESNLGVMLYNSHTNKTIYSKVAGAEEYSAMKEAEGVVQNFGYKASFPSLANVNGELTYIMVLKSDNGVVKQYGMVNYDDFTIAVTADTLAQCKAAYAKALANDGKVDNSTSDLIKVVVCVDAIEYIVNGGETAVYVRDTDGNVYKSTFDERFLFVKEGDSVTLTVVDASSVIKVVAYDSMVTENSENVETTVPAE